MKQFFKEIVKDVLFFVIAILLYDTLAVLIFFNSNQELFATRFEAIKDFFQMIYTGKIFSYPKFLGIFVIFIGIPIIVIRRISNYLSNKLNFTLVPLVSAAVPLFILPSVYIYVFDIEKLLIEDLKMMINFHSINSAIFLLVFSLAFATWVMVKRKKQIIPTQ